MKKFFSFMLAFVLVLSMSVTAFAAGETGSITITNATIGQDYSVYKLFDATYNETTKAVHYSIKETDTFFTALFGTDEAKTASCFTYDATTGAVALKEGTSTAQLSEYVQGIISNAEAVQTINAQTTTVEFKDLPYGYYVIKSGLGATVTITKNAPSVEVIDKNQQGSSNFEKKIWDDVAEDWADFNSVNFGDTVQYKITLNATNYDGENKIKLYSIFDTTGAAIFPDIDTIQVKVGDTVRTKGYHLFEKYEGTDTALGDWTPTNYATEAEWYLVQTGADTFRFSIPWMDKYEVTGSNAGGYALNCGDGAEFIYDASTQIEITYSATVGQNANVGGSPYNTVNTNNTNTAYPKWYHYHNNEADSGTPDSVHTYVYGIGVIKDDASTHANLSGAKFEVYTDESCTNKVVFVATEINGVYKYAQTFGDEESITVVETQANGRFVLLGMEAGTYYLKEFEPPAGYNILTTSVAVEIGEGKSGDFAIYANESGEVIDTAQAVEGFKEHSYTVTKTTISNNRGVELPSTGGVGTTMLITFGSLVAIAFAVFLITHKKMSVYED